jgi:hypothetical protein
MQPKRHKTKADLIALEQPPIHQTAVYTIEQAAAHTSFCPDVISQAIESGDLAYSGTGRRKIILGQWLLDWILKNAKNIAEITA